MLNTNRRAGAILVMNYHWLQIIPIHYQTKQIQLMVVALILTVMVNTFRHLEETRFHHHMVLQMVLVQMLLLELPHLENLSMKERIV